MVNIYVLVDVSSSSSGICVYKSTLACESERQNRHHNQISYLSTKRRRGSFRQSDIVSMIYQVLKCIL